VEHVRAAQPADLARCVELIGAAQAEARSTRGGELLAVFGDVPTAEHGTVGAHGQADPASLIDAWSSGDPARTLLVGLYEEIVVGLATGHVVEGQGLRLGRVDCCYVERDARQVGVGAALLEALLGWFATKGCSDVDAVALPGDRETKQLMEHAGFKARLLVLHHRLA
jgi:GNAT superfamily N-acetyltransferase